MAQTPEPVGLVAVPEVPGQGAAAGRGVLAGLVGAIAFTVFCSIVFAIAGGGALKPINLVAYTFWDSAPNSSRFHTGGLVLGMVILALAGIGIGAPLALLLHNLGPPHWALVLGLPIVIVNVLWAPGHYLIWPAIHPEAAGAFPPLWAWIGHSLYGLAFGMTTLALGEPRSVWGARMAQT
ncbi:MAG: hypothetical protein GEU94_02715 [Micromonosporaceae bacterium]|nr:hypothetical protein [Micromonosporaceae bacterium]